MPTALVPGVDRPLVACAVVRIGVLASGSGTILDAICQRELPVVVAIVDRDCAATEVAAHC